MASSTFSKPWQLPKQRSFVFYNSSIIDTLHGSIVKNATVRISNGRICSVRVDAKASDGYAGESDAASTPDDVAVDLQGKYLCPGLIDCHVHIAVPPGGASLSEYLTMSETVRLIRQPPVLKSMLGRGFTSVRDCGGASSAMKQAVEEGVHMGPRLFIAGKALSQTGGHGDMRNSQDETECSCGSVSGISRIVDGVPECLRYAREELRRGADFIKIMGGGGIASPTDRLDHLQFTDEEIRAIVTVAENAGTYVTSHCYTPQAIQQAINQGVRSIEHGSLIDAETAKLMAEKGVFLTPTLVAHVMVKEFNFLPPDSAEKNEMVLQKGLQALRIASDAGVTVCYGTDLLGPLHFAQSREFGIRSQVLSPVEILRSATVNAAALLMQADHLGQVKEGFYADVLILDKNPLEDITIFDKAEDTVLAVIKDGRVSISIWDGLKECI